jgi:hypothetical protein
MTQTLETGDLLVESRAEHFGRAGIDRKCMRSKINFGMAEKFEIVELDND